MKRLIRRLYLLMRRRRPERSRVLPLQVYYCVLLCCIMLLLRTLKGFTNIINLTAAHSDLSSRVFVAMTICGSRNREALISLKSALIHLRPHVHYAFHVWTDEQNRHIKSELGRFQTGTRDKLTVSFLFHDVVEDPSIQNLFARCSANRLLMPTFMSRLGIQRYIYVDVDVIWLDDPAKLMGLFDQFDESQQFGMTIEVEEGDWSYYKRHVTSGRPFYGQGGLQAGVGLYSVKDPSATFRTWLDIIQEFEKDLPLGDNDVLNVYLARNPDFVYHVPCRWNFRTDGGCTYSGMPGIVHGNRQVFHGRDSGDIFSAAWKLTYHFDLATFPAVADIDHDACCVPCPLSHDFKISNMLRKELTISRVADQLSTIPAVKPGKLPSTWPRRVGDHTLHIAYTICDIHLPAALLSIKSLLMNIVNHTRTKYHLHLQYQDNVNTLRTMQFVISELNKILPSHITLSAKQISLESEFSKLSACTYARIQTLRYVSMQTRKFISIDSDTLWLEKPDALWNSNSNSSHVLTHGTNLWFARDEHKLHTGVGVYVNIRGDDLLSHLIELHQKVAASNVYVLGFNDFMLSYVQKKQVTLGWLPCRWNQHHQTTCKELRLRGILHYSSQSEHDTIPMRSALRTIIRESHFPPFSHRHDNFAVCCNLGCSS